MKTESSFLHQFEAFISYVSNNILGLINILTLTFVIWPLVVKNVSPNLRKFFHHTYIFGKYHVEIWKW
jgi:hypothetical protein